MLACARGADPPPPTHARPHHSTTTLALGARQLASHGAIVARLAAIEEMAGMNMLCSDKTGTLTLNKMVIQVRLCRVPPLRPPPRAL